MVDMNAVLVSKVQAIADAGGWPVKVSVGTPGSTVEIPGSGVQDTGQAWKIGGVKEAEYEALGSVLSVIVDKLNEVAVECGVALLSAGDFDD